MDILHNYETYVCINTHMNACTVWLQLYTDENYMHLSIKLLSSVLFA